MRGNPLIKTFQGCLSLLSFLFLLLPCSLSAKAGEVLWSFQTGNAINSSPAVADDGSIYFGSDDYGFYGLNQDGTGKWLGLSAWWITSSPAIGTDGMVYVGTWEGGFFSINPLFSPDSFQFVNWIVTTGSIITSSAAVANDGTLYIGFSDKNLYSIKPEGFLNWLFITRDVIESSASIGIDGTIFVGSDDSLLYAIEPSGDFKWAFRAGAIISASPAIGEDGTVYIGAWNGLFAAIDPKSGGSLKWNFIVPGDFPISGSAVLAQDGTVYFGAWDGRLYAFDSQGQPKWSYLTDGIIFGTPAVGADGTIYIGSWDGFFYAINPDGTLKWRREIGSEISSSPAITPEGEVLFGAADGIFYALDTDTQAGLAHSFWPKFRRNLHNTGNAQLPGDVDRNGKIDIFDVLTLLSVLTGKSTSTNSDVNLDGKTDIFDLLALLRLLRSPGGTLLAASPETVSGRWREIDYEVGGMANFAFSDGSRLSFPLNAETPADFAAGPGLADRVIAGTLAAIQQFPADRLSLAQNYPNPFNPATTISYRLPGDRTLNVYLRVYDATGRLVRSLVSGVAQAGENRAYWDGLTESGRPAASGVYIYTLRAGAYTDSRKMVLLK